MSTCGRVHCPFSQKEMEIWERSLKQSEDSVRELVSQKRK